MKLNFKAIAIAAAMVAASSAHANLTSGIGGNGSFVLLAYNTDPLSGSYYVRDLGYTLNSFLPSTVTTTTIDGGGAAVTGDKSPNAGANISWGDTGGVFSSWLAGQTAANVKWLVTAGDTSTAAGTTNLSRALVSMPTLVPVTNGSVRLAATGSASLANQNNPMVYDASAVSGVASTTAFALGTNTLSSLDTASSLYYYATTQGTGASTIQANYVQFGNSAGAATLTLTSAGVLTYDLAAANPVSAVPLPASVWMMGAGLAGMGAFMRRRAAAAKA